MMTSEELQAIVEMLAADVRMLRLGVAQMLVDQMRDEPKPADALNTFARKIRHVLDANVPAQDADPEIARMYELTKQRFDELIDGAKTLMDLVAQMRGDSDPH
jgi:hypothetical protein